MLPTHSVRYTCKRGKGEYVIEFYEFEHDIEEILDVAIVQVDLIQIKYDPESSFETQNALTEEVLKYLRKNDCIVGYYCDFKNPMPNISRRHLNLLPQEIRQKLFTALFNRCKHKFERRDEQFSFMLAEESYLDPTDHQLHCVSFISRIENAEQISYLVNYFKKLSEN